ncbi:MAG: hypothetical protein HYV39_00755 [Candidatus Levybacteria bacterium]|nr:hypothetical protein [Candidatus Levybacteria bacterium]
MRKAFLLTSFIVITPLVLILQIMAIAYLSYQKNYQHPYQTSKMQKPKVAYAALPPVQNLTKEEISEKDARVEIIRQFFAKYKSPLEPYAEDVVTHADAFGLDFRLIPSIAMQESNLCHKAPEESNNCWGFGIYGKNVKRFTDYPEGIYQVTKTLATTYKNKGLETPEQIMTRYTPSSNGSWARGVSYFMNQLQ